MAIEEADFQPDVKAVESYPQNVRLDRPDKSFTEVKKKRVREFSLYRWSLSRLTK